MSFDDQYTLKLLYELAGDRPYRCGPSHVVPEAKFKISYLKPAGQEFKPFIIPQLKK